MSNKLTPRSAIIRELAETQSSAYKYDAAWDQVLPDGLEFCHWGGKALDRELYSLLALKNTDRVLDLCCGYGGMAREVATSGCELHGIDINPHAIKLCNEQNLFGNSNFICADAYALPFPGGYFDKIYSQDADSWLGHNKSELMRETCRVLKPGGQFVFQSYLASARMPLPAKNRTKSILRDLGYVECSPLERESLEQLFSDSNLRIKSVQSLHHVYRADTDRMLRSAEQALKLSMASGTPSTAQFEKLVTLMRWEQELFCKGWWTGILVVAEKLD